MNTTHTDFIKAVDDLLKLLRTTIEEVLPIYNAIPDSPSQRIQRQHEDENRVNQAMEKLGHSLRETKWGRNVVTGAVDNVTVVRGPRATTVIPRNKLHVRLMHEHGAPSGISINAEATKGGSFT